jgi:hypothetical protein
VRAIRLPIALVPAVLAAAAMSAAGPGHGQAPLPDCPPGTAPLPAPAPTVEGSPASPGRVVAGRPFSIRYETDLNVIVQDTLAPAGTTLDDPGGIEVSATVPAVGVATFTVRYYSSRPQGTCAQSLSFPVAVEGGDPLPARIGYSEGPTIRQAVTLRRLPLRGDLVAGAPVVGMIWDCSATTAKVPVVAELRAERALRRSPSPASPVATLTLADPCGVKAASAAAPGALLRYSGTSTSEDDDSRTLAVEHRLKSGARYSLTVAQAGRLLGRLRYYVAFRAQRGRFAAVWVIAPEAAFEAARCRRPPRGDPRAPLGFRKFPIPACPR